MGRSEKPLDPGAGPVQRFAHELRELRRASGSPTYRDMARRAGYSAPTLSNAATGDRLPSLPVTLAYVEACGGRREEWEPRWRALAEELSARPAAQDEDDPDDPAPYRGLARFDPEDGDLFFGRDQLVEDLVGLVRKHRFVAVVGASGSGKSSLLRAGLVRALRNPGERDGRPAAIRICTPGQAPWHDHGALLEPVAGDADTVLVVDQFEEVFTLCQDPVERGEFIDGLLRCRTEAASRTEAAGSRLRVVIAVRADFYGRCTEHPGLVQALNAASLLVGPMSPEQVREAIVKPARAGRLVVERDLTARIVSDVAQEPGALPLMSHALLELWRRRRGRTLTLAAYEAIGGVQGAVAHTAEEVFTGFTADRTELARSLLLRLITPGEEAPDTRRPADRAELVRSEAAAEVLEALVRARLVTVDGTGVDLAHEALITAWPRLRTWAETDRERLRLQRRLTESAKEWAQLERDPGALYRGARLLAARDAFMGADGPAPDLTPLEREFLTTSVRTGRFVQPALVRMRRFVRSRWWLAFRLALLCAVVLWTVWFLNRDHP
ncbi:nSTAND1 domain-containing NTPase [Streptomyces sp. HUAS TT20]|uniref:nSTAND1 domain-containing NTPase n=1 Tax=Streptomyces sp. HUAS TT20 TaxID=3447509 RepID=UPI00295308AE|nr:helix-turn-helix domain-containing protein [Streptomyces sp. HUAS 15-9]